MSTKNREFENTKSNDKREFSSELHSLYIQDVNEKKVLANKEKGLFRIEPPYSKYRFYVGEFFELKKGLHDVFNQLHNASPNDRLELVINSYGGMITEGQQFYNIIQKKFYNRTTAYLDNIGYSMGALLFCMAKRRVVYEYSDFMFHNYWGGVHGKGGEIKARVKHSSRVLERFFHDVIVKKGFLSEAEFKQMLIGQDYWMDTKELCKRGIATHVVINQKEISAKKYLKMLKNKKKKK